MISQLRSNDENKQECYNVGEFTFDLHRGILSHPQRDTVLRPKAHAVLAYLARNAGRVVPKDELMDAVWPGISVTDDSLFQSIRELRRSIGDDNQTVLRTISRRGYMLSKESDSGKSRKESPVVQLLPFRNETGDEAYVPLIESFFEDLTSLLIKLGTIKIIRAKLADGMTAARQFATHQVGSRSSPAYALEGTWRLRQDGLSMFVSLTENSSGELKYGNRYELAHVEFSKHLRETLEHIRIQLEVCLSSVTTKQ
jgi:DNA-binding winged helix-turn-helix (wHTH) protein